MTREDKVIADIVIATQNITNFIRDMERDDFEQDIKTQSAVLHQLTIVGEAVKLLPDSWREAHPTIPFRHFDRQASSPYFLI